MEIGEFHSKKTPIFSPSLSFNPVRAMMATINLTWRRVCMVKKINCPMNLISFATVFVFFALFWGPGLLDCA
jgi:hypothetical protein